MIQPTFQYIGLDNLCLSISYPRLPASKQGISENIVMEYLLLETVTTELMMSIGENDYFAGEMLLVVPDESDNGKYVVVEGNRRLTAVLLLSKPELATVRQTVVKIIADNAKFKPTELPCLVFPSRNDVQKYLGFAHITGKRSWRMLEKARYLCDISSNDKYKDVPFQQKCKEIAKTIGCKSPYVRKILICYELYRIVEDENFYQTDSSSDTNYFLYYFADGLLKDNIREFIGVDMLSDKPLENINRSQLKELCLWWSMDNLGGTRVQGDSESMEWLDVVLGNDVALKVFREGAELRRAYELAKNIDLEFRYLVQDALRAIERADRLSNKVANFDVFLSDDLQSIHHIARKINDFKKWKEKGEDDF